MSSITVEPYLFFRGDCREAMEFYKIIFGGELYFQTYAEAMGDKATEANKDLIMHASLKGGDADLLASDTEHASDVAKKVSISLMGEDEIKLRNIFERLSENVTVQFPLKKEFWGDIFGSVTDKYGIDWMVNISQKKT